MKKSNRQIVRDCLYLTNHPPRREALVMIPVSEDGTISGDARAFDGDREAAESMLKSEIERRIPPAFISGWLCGRRAPEDKR